MSRPALLLIAVCGLVIAGCATTRGAAKRADVDPVDHVLAAATELLGQSKIMVDGTPFRADCSGFVSAAYHAIGADAETVAAYALGLIGLCNVAGAYIFGALGDRFSKKNLLTGIYLARAVVMGLVLVLPINPATALLFGAAMGVLWLATVPLTSGIVAQVFGTRYFSMLFGVVFMGHQFGSFAGAWLGGYIYDTTGSYDMMWMFSVALALAAAALHWPINERPLARLSREAA